MHRNSDTHSDASGNANDPRHNVSRDCSGALKGSSEMRREWSEMYGFSVMSYNILADRYAKVHAQDLYSSVPKTCMKWSTRASLIAREISHWLPDIVCLQEVDRFKHLQSLLNRHGYQGKYLQRSSGRPDGLAMFWKQGKLALEHTEEICFASHGMRDNVAQVCALRILTKQGDDMEASEKCSMNGQHGSSSDKSKRRIKPVIVVTNIHVLFNPKRGDIKLGQVRILLETLGQVASTFSDQNDVSPPAILCGDFNSSPTSALHKYITTGFLNVHSTHRSDVSGQIACSRKSVTIPADDEPQVVLKRRHIKPWKAEEIEIATGRSHQGGDRQHCNSGSMSHPMSIKSSYAKVMGEEPAFSTAHDKYVGTVDYIFYTDGDDSSKWNIRPVQVLAPPPLHKILPKGLPNGFWPSDHISLCTKFVMYRRISK